MLDVSTSFQDKSICILGQGYVGLTLAVAMADVGFKVLGLEIQDDVLSNLHKGIPPFYEPGLKEKLQHLINRNDIQFSKHIPSDWQGSVFIVTVGTPLDENKKVRLDMISNVTKEISSHLKEDDLIIMRSTVKLGTTKNLVLPILEKQGKNFDLAFCPERTIEGKALSELRILPQIIGAISHRAMIRAAQIFQHLTPTIVRVSDVETAEMIKMVDNAQRDVHFAYANEVARISDAIGVSAKEVIEAGKFGYPRTNLPMPGPVGGPCLEKDPYILAEGLLPTGIQPAMTLTARKINENQPEEIISFLNKLCYSKINNFPKNPIISLMGLAFKGRPSTNDLRGTMAKPIFEALKKHFPSAVFRGYDAMVEKHHVENFGLEYCPTLNDAFKNSNLIMILNNHHGFSTMPFDDLAATMARPGLIYDFWNTYVAEKLHLPEKIGYIALGSHGRAVLP